MTNQECVEEYQLTKEYQIDQMKIELEASNGTMCYHQAMIFTQDALKVLKNLTNTSKLKRKTKH